MTARLSARPVGDANSIEAAAFVLGFRREFNAGEIQKFQSLKETFKDDLPSFEMMSGFSIGVQAGDVPPAISMAVNGILLQNFLPNGKPSWALRVFQNNIVVSCFAYDHWADVWAKAKDILRRTVQVIYNSDNPISMLSLQMVDKFVYDSEPEKYDINDIFNSESTYLTKHVVEAGALWHVNQGWFADIKMFDSDLKHLNVLNVMSSKIPPNGTLEGIVDHLSQIVFDEKSLNSLNTQDNVFADPVLTRIEEVFSVFHEGNKTVLQGVLSKQKLEKIGLIG
ncbi:MULTISPECIES: TIGR04255 family protein [Oxalobacteraceae]|uniref:TIGR04255 family protein n=1 Tax=Herminiimonas sp. Marseille-P9896 TaxID=2742211 RepID=UPI0015889E79|nr:MULTISPECIES: TIGR04255 family protein [Oxalobacteraceae]